MNTPPMPMPQAAVISSSPSSSSPVAVTPPTPRAPPRLPPTMDPNDGRTWSEHTTFLVSLF